MNRFLKKYLITVESAGNIFRNRLETILFFIHGILLTLCIHKLFNTSLVYILLVLGIFLSNFLIYIFWKSLIPTKITTNNNINNNHRIKKESNITNSDKNIQEIINVLKLLLNKFNINGKIVGHLKSATITRIHVELEVGTKVSKLTAISNEISLALGVNGGVRISQVQGQQYIGIEIPNKNKSMILLKDMINSKEFTSKENELKFCLGMSVNGDYMFPDLSKLVHILCGSQTGGGKSSFLNSLVVSLISKYSPDELKIIGIDPKKVELNYYKNIPHLLYPIVHKPEEAMVLLSKVVSEMESRYDIFSAIGARDIISYNKKSDEKMPRIVVIIDELFDLMESSSKETESLIARLASKARACGISLVLVTQKPTIDVCSGIIKSNMPSRIAFSVASQTDSRVILDNMGAEKLLGSGDGLIYPVGSNSLIRFQGAFVEEDDISLIVNKVIKKYSNYINIQNNDEITINDNMLLDEKKIELDEYEQKVLNYIYNNNSFTTREATSSLGISTTKLKKALESLREKNKIYQNEKQYLIVES